MMKMQLPHLWPARMHEVHPGKPGPGEQSPSSRHRCESWADDITMIRTPQRTSVFSWVARPRSPCG